MKYYLIVGEASGDLQGVGTRLRGYYSYAN